jgi:hypothetical protein
MKSEILHCFASSGSVPRLRSSGFRSWLALGVAAAAMAGCANPTDVGGSDEPGVTSAAFSRITDQEYVARVQDVLGVTLAGADAQIAGLSTRTLDTHFSEAVALDYQAAAQKVARQATASSSLTALLGTEAPSTTQVQGFISSRVSQLWQRPVTSSEMSRLTALYQGNAAAIDGGAANGIGALLQAVLQAPSFLFRT